jgi:hypothetical protein
MPNSRCLWPFILALSLASMPASPADVAALGKQRAAGSRLSWEVRDTVHPVLGPIRVAFPKGSIATPVGNAKVSSRVYVSCERSSKKMAIELAHATAPDDPGGLQPRTMPRFLCNKPAAAGEKGLVQEDIEARWAISDIGDVLARGLRPPTLRECVSIGIVQEVVLPKGWAAESARVEFEIAPYGRELDRIFVTCGEVSAYAPAAPATARTTDAPWKTARTVSSGKTNVRARPALDSALVVQLAPGATVLVQKAGGEWWRAKASAGEAFEGYIRKDRLVFK